MTHKKRIWYPGAKYHIICRGNKKRDIFLDKLDFRVFIAILKEVKNNYSYSLISYCLMPNHFHFLIRANSHSIEYVKESHRPNTQELAKNLGNLLSCYTQFFNRRNDAKGPLWLYHTNAKMLNGHSDNYPLICFQYIHQNPLRAGLVPKIEDWKFSSFNEFVGTRDSDLINKHLAFDVIGIREETFLLECRKHLDEDRMKQIW